MRRAATVLLGLLLAGACARRVTEPTTPLEWHAVRQGCTAEPSDECFWAAVSELRAGRATAGVRGLESICAMGHGRACGELASISRQGSHGQRSDGAKARAYAQKGCALGSPWACHEEGIALFRGLGGPKDLPRSTTLYEQACAQGDADACRDFGLATNEGRRDPPDHEKAKALWRQACPGSTLACSLLAEALATSDPVESRRFYELACEQGGEWGCHGVGAALETAGDLPGALRYHRSACAFGLVDGCTKAARLLSTLKPPHESFPEAERLLLRPDVQRTPMGRARLAMARIDRFGRTADQVAILEHVCHVEQHPLGCAFTCFLSANRASAPECATACRSGYAQFCEASPDAGAAPDGGLAPDAGTPGG